MNRVARTVATVLATSSLGLALAPTASALQAERSDPAACPAHIACVPHTERVWNTTELRYEPVPVTVPASQVTSVTDVEQCPGGTFCSDTETLELYIERGTGR